MPSVHTIVARALENLTSSMPKSHDLKSEIECYSLPYGALGFISHILTYYTLACLWRARSPMRPWRTVNCTRFDIILGLTSLLSTVGLAIYTLVKCRNTWELVLIAVWKLCMSLLSGLTAAHSAGVILIHGYDSDGRVSHRARDSIFPSCSRWLWLYVAGLICGVTGLMSLVKQHWHDKGVYTLTLVYVSVLGFIVFLVPCLFSILQGGWDSTTYCVALEYCVGVAFTTFALLAALYADWALGMMTDNLVGLPTSDNSVLYWCYFAAKRLPMASW